MRRFCEWATFLGKLRTFSFALPLLWVFAFLWGWVGAFMWHLTSNFFFLRSLPCSGLRFTNLACVTRRVRRALPLLGGARFWFTLFRSRLLSFSPFSPLLCLWSLIIGHFWLDFGVILVFILPTMYWSYGDLVWILCCGWDLRGLENN